MKKVTTLATAYLLFIFSILHSQTAQIFTTYDHSKVKIKYDAQGYIHVLRYDGKRFFETNNKNGYFGKYKPTARGIVRMSELTFPAVADIYDFDIDTAGVIHIAFVYLGDPRNWSEAYMFYTNSQIDTVYYVGKKTAPSTQFNPDPVKLNVIRTTDNQIVVNFLFNFRSVTSTSTIKWTQLVNPSANNITPMHRDITVPGHSLPPGASMFTIPFANKNLFVNTTYYSGDFLPPADTLYVEYYLSKYDINGQADQHIVYSRSFSTTLIEVPLYMADYNNSYVGVSKFQLRLYETGAIGVSFPLDNSIYTLDRNNKLHLLKWSSPNYHYYFFQNLPVSSLQEDYSLYHRINRSAFPESVPDPGSIPLDRIHDIAAFNPNDAVISLSPGYLIRQKQGSFIYKFLATYRSLSFGGGGSNYYKALNLIKYNNNPYLFNTFYYDTSGIAYLFELKETNNEIWVEFDSTSIKKINLPASLIAPIARVDKNNQIHLLVFKVLFYQYIANGQWYYYKLTPDLQLQGGYRVMPDTLTSLSYIDFDIDDNGVAHVAYVRFDNKIYYTNNSSGTFSNPIFTGATLSTSGTNWVRIRATKDGNVYVVYLNSVSGVNFVYGNLNGFSNPKRLFVSENIDLFGGRTTLAFEVDRDGNMHCFEISYWTNYSRDLLSYKYKLVRDSVVMIPTSIGLYTSLDSPQFVSIMRDRNRNIYVLGFTKTQKIYRISSLDNFRNVVTYDLRDFGLLNYLSYMPFWDTFKPFVYEDLRRIYFIAGEALKYDVIGFIPDATTNVEEDKNIIPNKFVLYQNYPNPFNPSTRIEFEIPQREHVKLTIHDILGREVMRIIDKEFGAGKYSVNVDMSGHPSGVYFYRLEAGRFVSVKKMMLIK